MFVYVAKYDIIQANKASASIVYTYYPFSIHCSLYMHILILIYLYISINIYLTHYLTYSGPSGPMRHRLRRNSGPLLSGCSG